MRRRTFISLVGAAAAWPLAARGQQTAPRAVGFLCLGNPDPGPFLKSLRAGLHDLGYVEGKDIQVLVKSGNGNVASMAALATELVSARVSVIVAFQSPAAAAAKAATKDIPIVMWAADSVQQGFAQSLSRPGGNLTGVDPAGVETAQKNLEIIREILPAAQRIAVLTNANDPFHEPFLEAIKIGADRLNIELNPILLHSAGELDTIFADMEKWQAKAVLVQPSISQQRIADLALQHRIPSFGALALVELGALASYAADQEALYRRCADFVGKILKGAKPADLPIELPTKFWLAINLRTARALGVGVPPTVLARTDQVIE